MAKWLTSLPVSFAGLAFRFSVVWGAGAGSGSNVIHLRPQWPLSSYTGNSSGWKAVLVACKGDLEFWANDAGMPHWNHEEPCGNHPIKVLSNCGTQLKTCIRQALGYTCRNLLALCFQACVDPTGRTNPSNISRRGLHGGRRSLLTPVFVHGTAL